MPHSLAEFVCTDLVVIGADDSLATLEARLDRPVDYGVPVIGECGYLHGVIHPTDILRISMQLGSRARTLRASEFCHRVRGCLSNDTSLRRARRMLLTRDLDSLLIIDSMRRVVGILFRRDLERDGLLPRRITHWRRPMRHPDVARHDGTRQLFSELAGD